MAVDPIEATGKKQINSEETGKELEFETGSGLCCEVAGFPSLEFFRCSGSSPHWQHELQDSIQFLTVCDFSGPSVFRLVHFFPPDNLVLFSLGVGNKPSICLTSR